MAARRSPPRMARKAPAKQSPTSPATGTPRLPTGVVVSWQAADGPRNTPAELTNLNDNGYVVLRIAGVQTMWIPQPRIFNIVTSTVSENEAAALVETTAVEAAAVLEAAAEGARETSD